MGLFKTKVQKKVIIILLVFLLGCSSAPITGLEEAVYYLRDLNMEVNGTRSFGRLVVPRASQYKVKIRFPGQGDLVTMKTCHRESTHEELGRKEEFTFTPVPGIEDTGICFLEISVFEMGKGRHAWGIVDFEHPMFTLPATVRCNGWNYRTNGTSICQSKIGLVQTIVFDEPVETSSVASCGPLKVNGRFIEYRMPKGECTYIIKGASNKLHKLTLIGYEKILIRKN